jgi:hypothetical protein
LAWRRIAGALRTESGNEVWRHQADKFTRRDDLRILPVGRKVFTIARDQKVCASRVGALDKDVVVRIACYLDMARGSDKMAMVLDDLKELKT